jgi:hypothetical protein
MFTLLALVLSLTGLGGCAYESEQAWKRGEYATTVTLWNAGAFLGLFGTAVCVLLIMGVR